MKPSTSSTDRCWRFGDHCWTPTPIPKIMGIVNVTPDSFSDGGQWNDLQKAIDHAFALIEQGADILDIGGESTRPGAEPVSADEELHRVLPVIESLAKQTQVPISIDTMKAAVAQAAIAAGASVINDVSAFEFDPGMLTVAQNSNCGIILMHMLGNPQSMQDNPVYNNVVEDVTIYLESRANDLTQNGISSDRIVIDPGIGFGKTAQHNLELLTHIYRLHKTGYPVLIGHSRKRFLGKLIGKPVDERLAGTIGVSIALAQQGVEILRVHDVAAVKDALTAWQKLQVLDR